MNTEDTTSEGQQSVAETSSSSLIDKVRTSDQNQNRDLVEQLSNLVINQRNDRWILADSTLAQGPVTLYFCEARHDGQNSAIVGSENGTGLVAKWRSKERLKTTAVALVMALNIGNAFNSDFLYLSRLFSSEQSLLDGMLTRCPNFMIFLQG